MSDIFFQYSWDNDFIILTFDFIACSNAAHVTCSTDTYSHGLVGKNMAQKMSVYHCTNFTDKMARLR